MKRIKYLHGKIDILNKNQNTESRLFRFPEQWKTRLISELITELLEFLPNEKQIKISVEKLSQAQYKQELKKRQNP